MRAAREFAGLGLSDLIEPGEWFVVPRTGATVNVREVTGAAAPASGVVTYAVFGRGEDTACLRRVALPEFLLALLVHGAEHLPERSPVARGAA